MSSGQVKKKRYRSFRYARIASQALFLLLFFFLFIKTDYSGSDTIEYAVNILFRIDPLLAFSTMLALRTFIALMLPSLVVIGLSLLFGRSFCGWICPMGSLIDLSHPALKPRSTTESTKFPDLAKVLLVLVLISSLLQFPLAGYLDPFSLLVRSLAQALYPAFNNVAVSFFSFTYDHAPAAVNTFTEPLYALMKETVLPFAQRFYDLALVSLLLLVGLFGAELVQRRFFCRNICPLGALLGWIARLGLLDLQGGDSTCGRCRHCITICRMGAIDGSRKIHVDQCSLCLECLEQCPRQIIALGGTAPLSRGAAISLSRRRFLGALTAGLLIPPVLGVRRLSAERDPLLIRPPGARSEAEFLQRCVRCAECIQVCIGNALQPTGLQAGLEGVFTPRLVARTGYCEFNCTLCGQVCPTGAIRTLSLAQKHTAKIGHAWFDRNICLPYAKGIPCMVCEEHCPTPDKAIKFRTATILDDRGIAVAVQQPYVVDELCIGCGICETKCPLPGRSAVMITSAGEDRDPENALPLRTGSGEGYGYGRPS